MRWKLVPTTPTPEMRDAANHEYGADTLFMGACIREAIAASPPASQDEELVERVRELISAVLLKYGDEYSFGKAARAVIKMLEGGE